MERSFAFGRDALFRDMETAERMLTQPWHIEQDYRKAIGDFIARFKRECREHAIDYVVMDTATPFDLALTEYLAKRVRIQ
jgi:hypothetical protein